MSVKIALKVVSLDVKSIPENVYIYIGSMVFGCLVAQDVIRLTHDAFKADSSSSDSVACNAHSTIKRIFWMLRVFVNCLVFVVVYGKEAGVGILPYISSLFSLCLIKCFTPHSLFSISFPKLSPPHYTFRYGLDFCSRCFLPKIDPVHSVDAHGHNHGADGHDASHCQPQGHSLKHDNLEAPFQYKSSLGRRMSTFALSTASLAKPRSPKLEPNLTESPEMQPPFSAEPAGVKVLTLQAIQNNILALSRAANTSQQPQDYGLYQAGSDASVVNPANLISARKARQRMLPSVRSQQSPDQRNGFSDLRSSTAQLPQRLPSTSGHMLSNSPRSRGTLLFGSSDVFAPAASVYGNSEGSPKVSDAPADEVMMNWRNGREEVRGAASRS